MMRRPILFLICVNSGLPLTHPCRCPSGAKKSLVCAGLRTKPSWRGRNEGGCRGKYHRRKKRMTMIDRDDGGKYQKMDPDIREE